MKTFKQFNENINKILFESNDVDIKKIIDEFEIDSYDEYLKKTHSDIRKNNISYLKYLLKSKKLDNDLMDKLFMTSTIFNNKSAMNILVNYGFKITDELIDRFYGFDYRTIEFLNKLKKD